MKTLYLIAGLALAQNSLFAQELSINAFRNPSVGVEYRYDNVSAHAGFYPTIISTDADGNNETSTFMRAGVSFWFLPIDDAAMSSSFYASASYARGLNEGNDIDHGAIGELGFRWMVWKGLNLRLGVAALFAPGETVKINPTPGISYSFILE